MNTADKVEPGDIVLHQSHTYRVIEVYKSGGMLYLAGRHTNTIVCARSVTLVYRAADVPPTFAVGMLNPEQEAALVAVVAQRTARNGKQGMDKEKDGDDIDTQ